jgi:pimeloyl-ACP methyl ester carboxylesterase
MVEHLIDLRLSNPQPPHAYLAQVAAGAAFNLSDQAQNISAPTLILAAENDRLAPVANAYNLAKKIPKSQLKIYEGLGHQFFVEIPEKFNQEVINFLKTNSIRGER